MPRRLWTLVAVVTVAAPLAAQPPAIRDTPTNRRDFAAIAERLSMDVRFELIDINAKTLAAKLRKYGTLDRLANAADPGLARLAEDTTKAYLSLESIHFIYQPQQLDLDDLFLAAFTRLFAEARLANDAARLRQFQHQAWTRAMPYAEAFAGPEKKGAAVLGVSIGNRVALRNTSGKALTNCTLAVSVHDVWGRNATATYFLPEWKAGETYCEGSLRHVGVVGRVGYRVYADELRQARDGLETETSRAAVRQAETVRAVFGEGKAYSGRWTPAQKGKGGAANLSVKAFSNDGVPFEGPTVKVAITDPAARKTFNVSGRLQVATNAAGDPVCSVSLSGGTGGTGRAAIRRTFNLKLDGDELVGRDSVNETFRFKLN